MESKESQSRDKLRRPSGILKNSSIERLEAHINENQMNLDSQHHHHP